MIAKHFFQLYFFLFYNTRIVRSLLFSHSSDKCAWLPSKDEGDMNEYWGHSVKPSKLVSMRIRKSWLSIFYFSWRLESLGLRMRQGQMANANVNNVRTQEKKSHSKIIIVFWNINTIQVKKISFKKKTKLVMNTQLMRYFNLVYTNYKLCTQLKKCGLKEFKINLVVFKRHFFYRIDSCYSLVHIEKQRLIYTFKNCF